MKNGGGDKVVVDDASEDGTDPAAFLSLSLKVVVAGPAYVGQSF